MTGATAILVVQVEIDPDDEAEFNRWYDEEHIPEKLATRGFLSARRFRVHDGTPRYLAVYELAEPQAALSAEYMATQPSEWGKRVMERWRTWNREVWIDLAAQPPSSAADTGRAAAPVEPAERAPTDASRHA